MPSGVAAGLLGPNGRTVPARLFRLAHHVVLAVGLVAVALATMTPAPLPWTATWIVVLAATAFFAAEWALRLSAARPRRRYLLSFLGLVDLAAACVGPLALALAGPAEAGPALAVAMLWLLKLARYVPGFTLIGRVLHNERGPLASVLAAFAIVLLLAATAEYVLERDGQPDTFGSVPAALWWCIVTLSTTGYGDAIPATAIGRAIAGLVMVTGIAIFALWAGILATGFAAEVRRRDFLRTWDLVARVPLFQNLGAGVIAEVARLLRPRSLPAGAQLMRKGEPGDCMFFIVDGAVEVKIAPPVRLGAGAFLGEMALITGAPRVASVVAAAPTQLLVLDIADFRETAGRHPDLLAAIEAEAARRAGPAAPSATP